MRPAPMIPIVSRRLPAVGCNRRALLGAALAWPWAAARAQPHAGPRAQPMDDPPLRGLQIVGPAPPGAQPDLIARWLIEPIGQRAGVPAVVLNRPGAAGAIAADAVLSAPPQSGALLLGGLDHVAYSHLNSGRRPLDPFADFVPVGTTSRDTWLLVCAAAQPFGSPAALADASRRDGGLRYASGGEGSTAHLLSARLCHALGIDAAHIPYKDAWLPDLIAGRVHFTIAPTPAVIGQVRGGALRALASLTDRRLPQLDQVPSIAELGWPDQTFTGGLWLFAPAVLAPRAADFNGWLREAMQRPEIAARYRDAGIEAAPLDLEQTRAAVRERLAVVDAMRVAVFGRAR